jgi:A/G-specific adenine glycosylase
MLGWPGTAWDADHDGEPPAEADWRLLGEVRHIFTHFHLVLEIHAARLPLETPASRGHFRHLDPGELPTVMRKVHALAAPALRQDRN